MSLLRHGALKLKPPNEELLRIEGLSIAAYLVLFTVMHLMRSARWYLLLAPVQRVPLGTVVRVALIGYLAIALLPFRMGEAARPLLIRRDAKLSAWAATGTVGAERLIDGLTVSLLLLAALRFARPMDPLPDHIGNLQIPVRIVPSVAVAMASAFATGCVVMGIFYWRRAWAERMTHAVVGLVSARFARWISTRLAETASGLGFLTKARYTAPYLALTLAYWLLNAATFWVLAQGCGLDSIGYFRPSRSWAWSGSGSSCRARLVSSAHSSWPSMPGSRCTCLRKPSRAPARSTRSTGYVLPIGLTVLFGAAAALVTPAASKVGPEGGSRLAPE